MLISTPVLGLSAGIFSGIITRRVLPKIGGLW